VEYRVEVLRRWKGDIPPTVSIWTPDSGAACGVELDQGVAYIIYASTREARVIASIVLLLCGLARRRTFPARL
jgi:hypothetical protein